MYYGVMDNERINKRVNVALVADAKECLRSVQERTGLNQTVIVNRSVVTFEFVYSEISAGNQVLIRGADGTEREVRLLF